MVTYITNKNSSHDGFGSHYNYIIGTIIYAELHGLEYVYTRPELVNIYPSEADVLHKIMNIEGSYTKASSDVKQLDYIDRQKYIAFNIDKCIQTASMVKIKRLFREANSNPFDKEYFNVAIHIRRPGLNPLCDVPDHYGGMDIKIVERERLHLVSWRYIEDGFFVFIMDHIRSTHKDKNIMFHIYSEGKEEDFQVFRREDVILHINEAVSKTFVGLVYANLLVTSPSTFSYTAGLLSDGIVHCKTIYHYGWWGNGLIPPKHWMIWS